MKKTITNIPIEIIKLDDSSFHIMISVRINDSIDVNLIIDTGASKTVFDTTTIGDFCDEVEAVEEHNSSGITELISEAKTANMPQIAFGSMKIQNYKCVLLDLSHINAVYKGYSDKKIAGLLGGDFLVKYKAVINYKQKTLKIYS
jgi:hypothetical protein